MGAEWRWQQNREDRRGESQRRENGGVEGGVTEEAQWWVEERITEEGECWGSSAEGAGSGEEEEGWQAWISGSWFQGTGQSLLALWGQHHPLSLDEMSWGPGARPSPCIH